MTNTSPILVSIDADEANHPKARRLTMAIKSDGHFLLEEFNLRLQPKWPGTYLCDCQGIGPKLASAIQKTLDLPDGMAARPAEPKADRLRPGERRES